METSARVPEIAGVSDLTLIARGGSGVIYRGRQETLARDVAVKVLTAPAASDASLDRWQRELKAMGRLSNHPNIVAVYDSGLTADGLPYLVMPFVPGGSLGDRVRTTGPLSPDEAVGIGAKLAHALTAAHEAGVLHRDVKPDNVLLSPYEPQLADFGIARLVDSTTATAAGQFHATINYAAPEVLAGEPASEASDVYGLAATLYTALRGEVPFPHAADASPVAVMHQIVHEPVPDLRGTAVPAEVAAVITAGMAKDPAGRPASAMAFGLALGQALEGAPPDTTAADTAAFPAAATERITVTQPATAPQAAPPKRATPPRRRGGGVVVAGVVVLLAVGALLLGLNRDGDRGGTTTPTAAPTTTASRTGGQPTGSSAVTDAAGRYFSLLGDGNYAGAYAMLSPGFKAAQTQASFESFWRSASPVAITGEVTARGLIATVPVQMGGGRQTYALSFTRGSDGKLYVDGPRPR